MEILGPFPIYVPLMSGRDMLASFGRKQFIELQAVAAMPDADPNEKEIFFVKPPPKIGYLNKGKELRECCRLHRPSTPLKPANPHSVAAFNKSQRDFADKHPNATQRVIEGNNPEFYYLSCGRYGQDRGVYVSSRTYGWDTLWWFGMVPDLG